MFVNFVTFVKWGQLGKFCKLLSGLALIAVTKYDMMRLVAESRRCTLWVTSWMLRDAHLELTATAAWLLVTLITVTHLRKWWNWSTVQMDHLKPLLVCRRSLMM